MPTPRTAAAQPTALPSPAAAMASPSTYRIEHRRGDAVVVVAYSDDPLAPYTELGPHAMRLLDAGATGVLLLVEQATGDLLGRRALLADGAAGRDAAPAPAAASDSTSATTEAHVTPA